MRSRVPGCGGTEDFRTRNGVNSAGLNTSKARVASLVVCLVLLASLLGSLSGGLAPPLSKVVQQLPFLTQTVTSTSGGGNAGKVLVNATLTIEGFRPVPIPNATVILIKESTGSTGSFPVETGTNSSGEAVEQLFPGNYSLKVFDQLFSTEVTVQVSKNVTTVDDLTVLKLSDQVVFSDLSDEDSAGSVAPWQSVTLAVTASTAVANGSNYYLDVVYYQSPLNGSSPLGSYVEHEEVIGVTMESSQLSGAGQSSLLWLTLHPVTFVPLQNMTSLSLVTFDTVTRISYHGY